MKTLLPCCVVALAGLLALSAEAQNQPAPDQSNPAAPAADPATPPTTPTAAAADQPPPTDTPPAQTPPTLTPPPAAQPFPTFPPPRSPRRGATNRVSPSATSPPQFPLPRTTGPVATPAGQQAPPPSVPGQVPAGAVPTPGQGAGTAPATGATAAATDTAATNLIAATDLYLPAMPLEQFLDIYAELDGRTILRPAQLPGVNITLKAKTGLSRTDAIRAFDTVLALNGITMIPVDDKFITAVPTQQALQEGAPFTQKKRDELPEGGQYTTHIVQLRYAKASEVATVLQSFAKMPNGILAIDSSQILVIRDYAANVKRMLEVLDRIDVDVPREFDMEVIPIKYALASDIANVIASLTAGGGNVTTTGTGTALGGVGTGAGGITTQRMGARGTSRVGGLGRAGTLGYGGYGTTGTGYVQPGTYRPYGELGPGFDLGADGEPVFRPYQAAPATPVTQPAQRTAVGTARSNFQDRLRNIINRAAGEEVQILGEVKLVADERTNAILVFANQQDLKMIKRIIGELDKVQSQVLIEAIIMEVSLTDSLNYGVSATQNPKAFGRDFTGAGAILNGQGFLNNLTNFPGSLGSGFSYLGTLGRDRFDVALSALAADNRVNILQRPRIQTSHAVPASIFIGESRPYPTGSSYGGLYGGFNTINQLQIGIGLDVLPIINPDGLVVMEINQTVNSVGGEVQIANVGPVPSTIDRQASATVAVRDGDTVVVGGFINNQKNKSKSGVPILKDIPLLGALFRSTASRSQRTELVILIRPTVLPTPEVAAVTKLNEEERLPAVIRHAQEEMSIEERRRDEKFQREIEKLQRRP